MGKTFSRPTNDLRRRPITRANSAPLSNSPDRSLNDPDFHHMLSETPSSVATAASVPRSHHTPHSFRSSVLYMAQRLRRRSHLNKNPGSKPSHVLSPGDSSGRFRHCLHSPLSCHRSLCVTHSCTKDSPTPCEKVANHAGDSETPVDSSNHVESWDVMRDTSSPHVTAAPRSFTLPSPSRPWNDTTLRSDKPEPSSTAALLTTSSPMPPLPSSWLSQIRPSNELVSPPALETNNRTLNFSEQPLFHSKFTQARSKSTSVGMNGTQPSTSVSEFGGATRPSFVRPHQRRSPYERCLTTSPCPSACRNLRTSSFEQPSAQAYISSISPGVDHHKGDFTPVSTFLSNPPSFTSRSASEAPSCVKQFSLTQAPMNNASDDIVSPQVSAESPLPYNRRFRFPSTASTVSLTSEDFMLDTDPSLAHSPVENTSASPDTDSKLRYYGSCSRDHSVPTRLESVTEVSHDNLTDSKLQRGETSNLPEVQPLDHRRQSVPQTPLNELSTARCVCQMSTDCNCRTCPKCAAYNPELSQSTNATSDSLRQRALFSRRRLRSLPGRARASSLSPSIYATLLLNESEDPVRTSLGERAAVLSAADQRNIVQDIQGVKLLLLKLRRLLTEDQWHVPVFSKQLSMTGPIRKPRARHPLPVEWLDLQSTKSPHEGTESQLSDLNPVDSGHISDETISPKLCDVTYQLSVTTDEKITTPPSADPSLVRLDAASRLIENLSLLQAENNRLGPTSGWFETL